MGKEFDLITAVGIIEAVEKSPYFGDFSFLKEALGEETFVKMLKLGYIGGGMYLTKGNDNNVIINRTYGVSQRYIDMRDIIKRERRWYNSGIRALFQKLKSFLSQIL